MGKTVTFKVIPPPKASQPDGTVIVKRTLTVHLVPGDAAHDCTLDDPAGYVVTAPADDPVSMTISDTDQYGKTADAHITITPNVLIPGPVAADPALFRFEFVSVQTEPAAPVASAVAAATPADPVV